MTCWRLPQTTRQTASPLQRFGDEALDGFRFRDSWLRGEGVRVQASGFKVIEVARGQLLMLVAASQHVARLSHDPERLRHYYYSSPIQVLRSYRLLLPAFIHICSVS